MTACSGGGGTDTRGLSPAAVSTVSTVSTPSPSPSPSTTPTQVGGAIPPGPAKAPIAGLIDMQAIQFHNQQGIDPAFTMANIAPSFSGLFGGIVINAAWDQVQPSQSGALDFSYIDGALAQVRSFNATNPQAPLGVKLRLYAGVSTPAWATQLDGPPVQIYRNPAGCNGNDIGCPLTVGKFWAPNFITAWRSLQTQLAAKYDSEPLIRQVSVTSCAAQTDEPFVPSIGAQSKARGS